MKMSLASKSIVLLLSICAASGADKNTPFKPGPVESYPFRQTQEKVTIVAEPFDTEAETSSAFGKLDPNLYGVLPLLLIVKNDGPGAIMIENMKLEYMTDGRQRIEATPARDLARLQGTGRPRISAGPIPNRLPRTGTKKNPLAAWELEGRAFSAQALPPGELASGFFYFQVRHRAGAVLFVTGVRDAAAKRDLFYFEIPLDK
jgi:hypothetical protein